jgi:DNA-binding CsgD family transcriptional regulator/tetratricopeptide (TPR) repeat protein
MVKAGPVAQANGLVGREPELAVAAAALSEVEAGRAAALAIEGEAGIGKTSLVHRLVDDARARRMTTFYGAAHPFERTRPFAVVAAALGLDRRSADPRAAAIGHMLAGGSPDPPAPASEALHHRVVEEIVDLVEASCAEHPVLLVAEDLHWADSASLRALSSVVRQLPLSPVLVAVTTRPSPLSAEVVRLLDDLASAGGSTVSLAPLDPDAVATLASQRLGAPPGPALTEQLAKAGGNSLLAVALLRSLEDEGLLCRDGDVVETTSSELPASLSDLVVRRLRHLPAGTRELLQVTAVLGDAVSLRDVAAVAGRSPTEVVGQLDDAFGAQLLDDDGDRVVFRHQLVHDAIYHHVPAAARRLLHREAAAALKAAGADPLDIADQVVLGAERGDVEAVGWLRDAAREASARAPVVAVELLRRAEALLPGGHRDADLVSTEVVGALLRAGQVADASDRAEAVLARRHDPAVDVPLRAALMGALALQNRAEDLIEVARVGLRSPGLAPSGEVPMLVHQSWALTYSGDSRGGEASARHALGIAAGDAGMTVSALTALLIALGRQGRYGEALAHARRAAALAADSLPPGSMPVHPKLFLGLALFDCDLVDEARAAYRAALDDEFASGWWHSDTLTADAQASFAIGEWDDAVPGLIARGDAAREKDHALLLSQSLAYRAVIATARGDHDAATALVAAIAGSVAGEPMSYNAGALASAVAGLADARGDQPGAYDQLLRCWRFEDARDDRYYDRCLAPDLVRLALALGHRDVAEEVAATVAADVALAPEIDTVRSQALRCEGLVGGDVDLLLEAVAIARGTPLLVEHTGACEDAARTLVEAGRGAEAVPLLAEALERHERAGADAWAGRVRAQLRALGVRPGRRGPRNRPSTGWDSLTVTEREVSRLVAQGLTNVAVAKRLYISPHTVNTHLRHVFAKLGISNRVALAAEVNRSIE